MLTNRLRMTALLSTLALYGLQASAAPLANAAMIGGAVTPIYAAGNDAISFAQEGAALVARDQNGNERWRVAAEAGVLFGGFDFDQDGITDAGIARGQTTGETCGTTAMRTTWIDLVRGRNGEILRQALAPMKDICWNFGTAIYPTSQWTHLAVLFGDGPGFAASPYYASTLWNMRFANGGLVTSSASLFPSTGAYDSAYPGVIARNPYGERQSHVPNAHTANGLVIGNRVVFFTSARVVEYDMNTGRLLADRPFLNGGRKDLSGRNYGIVARDPAYPAAITLIAGTSAQSVFSDLLIGSRSTDAWGGIERHVTRYDTNARTIEHRYYSYAHDRQDGNQYEGRVVYPDHIYIKGTGGNRSRIAYNVFAGGHWQLHISQPGSTRDYVVYQDFFLWDIVSRDDQQELLVSPAPNGYFPTLETRHWLWRDATSDLVERKRQGGVIPYLLTSFRRPDATASSGSMAPTALVAEGTSVKVIYCKPAQRSCLAVPETSR